MNSKFKPLSTRLITVLVFFVTLSPYTFSLVILNRGGAAFEDNTASTKRSFSEDSIESSIISGASNFMKSYSEALIFLQAIEASAPNAINYDELQPAINKSINYMQIAVTHYAKLCQLAELRTYNRGFIEKLVTFDYFGLQYSKGMNLDTMYRVQYYLGNGDVRGIFKYLLNGSEKILYCLRELKASIMIQQCPKVDNIWRVNNMFTETMITGQYAAEVFYSISGY